MFFYEYGLFLLKAITLIILIFLPILMILGARKESKESVGEWKLTSLNEHYEDLRDELYAQMLDKKAWKAYVKGQKQVAKKESEDKPHLFVLDFDGDIQASAVDELREQISVIVQVAGEKDSVLLRLESAGGFVHSYGLAASQLARLKTAGVPLTIAVDKVAASGGYMMACVADTIMAAPFAVIGSVGVVAELANFNDLLEKNDVHYEQFTAGKYKRTISMFGKNTDEGKAKFQEELNDTLQLFKAHIQSMRPNLAVDEIATGETWYGTKALEKGLIDNIQTSDDYLLTHLSTHQILHIQTQEKRTLLEKIKEQLLELRHVLPFKAKIR